MDYDRRIPDPLLDLLLPDAPLAWLLPWLRTDAARQAGAHVQTRRNRRERRRGGVQVYLGRTSPLEIRARPAGQVRLHAHRSYTAITPDLFGRDQTVDALVDLAGALQRHVEASAEAAHRSLVGGEAVIHAGLMRAYGPLAPSDAAWQALDSEARTGFDSRADQVAFEASLSDRVGLPAGEAVPRKLDTIAVDRAGRVLLVEVKKDATGMTRAAWQAAVHVARYRALGVEHPRWASEVLAGMAAQKARVGLVTHAWRPVLEDPPVLVPVLAAPDPRPGWSAAWRAEIAPVRAACRGHLDGLRLWRLAGDGVVLEDVAA